MQLWGEFAVGDTRKACSEIAGVNRVQELRQCIVVGGFKTAEATRLTAYGSEFVVQGLAFPRIRGTASISQNAGALILGLPTEQGPHV